MVTRRSSYQLFTRATDEGSVPPQPFLGFWHYGVAFDEWHRDDVVWVYWYPVPWNWVRAFFHWIYLKLAYPQVWRRLIWLATQRDRPCPHCGRR